MIKLKATMKQAILNAVRYGENGPRPEHVYQDVMKMGASTITFLGRADDPKYEGISDENSN